MSGSPHIMVAKTQTLCRERERCLAQVSRAVEVGSPRRIDQVCEVWPQFLTYEALDQTEAWQELVKRMGKQPKDGLARIWCLGKDVVRWRLARR